MQNAPLFTPQRLRNESLRKGDNENLRKTDGPPPSRKREVLALGFATMAILAALSLASYRQGANHEAVGENWIGPVGEFVASCLVQLFGVMAWAIPFEAFLLSFPFIFRSHESPKLVKHAGDVLVVFVLAALIHVAHPTAHSFGEAPIAGVLGEVFGELSRSLFSTIGSYVVGLSLLGFLFIMRARFSFVRLVTRVSEVGAKGAVGTAKGAREVKEAWQKARDIERARLEEAANAALPKIAERLDLGAIAALPEEDSDPGSLLLAGDDDVIERGLTGLAADVAREINPPAKPKRAPKKKTTALDVEAEKMVLERRDLPKEDESEEEDGEELGLEEEEEEIAEVEEPKKKRSRGSKSDIKVDAKANEISASPAAVAVAASMGNGTAENAEPKKRALKKGPAEPTIVDTSAALKLEVEVEKEKEKVVVEKKRNDFHLPSIDFLVMGKVDPSLHVDRETLLKNADLLIKTLADYGVSGKVEDILPGPTITTYEVSPAAGTKVSKVASLADDLALALARKVRIVAPIPGKNRIGFELPNERRVPVNLRELVEDRRFQSMDAPLPVVLGRDNLGSPVYADLASMPHVIVAGATGAGKSVGLNVMLTSLLYRRTPDELRLLMIDPKVVELAPFDRIPHMLLPVVTDMKQAANALKWAVDEMERRYQLFADAGTKNMGTYNNWVERVQRGELKNPLPKVVITKDPNGFFDVIPAEDGEQQLPEKLPSIVIVVDEFADLMMQQGKDVETAVARLAQKARAAGMHVILATQRPSVDVITGMIKANFPTRIAFRVAQKVDSRTILDEMGAEHLLGRGDMLIKLNGTNEMKRVQCPMVSEEEVQEVTDFLRSQGEPVYDQSILKPRDEDESEDEEDAEQDTMYDDAVRIVADTGRCSTSWLQRKLGLGYNRAARIVEMMEKRGIVGPANGSKDREVLISSL